MRARFFYHVKAVDLRSSHGFVLPSVEAHNELYQAALPDIAEVLRSVCKRFKLPLALTWAPCLNQGKSGCLETRFLPDSEFQWFEAVVQGLRMDRS
ncbi:hypothetical protein V6N13_017048 [Hibiscus sabdariffa]